MKSSFFSTFSFPRSAWERQLGRSASRASATPHRTSIIRGSLALLLLLITAAALHAQATDAIDMAQLRRIHQKAQSGQKLTPDEQTYYERGKAARQKASRQEKKARPAANAAGKAPAAGKTSTGLIPVTDMTAGQTYLGQDGGLYGGGSNAPPPAQLALALKAAQEIQPLDKNGQPSSSGRIVLLTHGMSNTTQESQQFIQLATADPRKNPALVIVDGAQGGIDSRKWIADIGQSGGPWDRLDQRLKAADVSREQVQVVWMKHAIARVAQHGEFPRHAETLKDDQVKIVEQLKQRFPNLKLAYLSSRTYAGYATTELNPEPFAYESAFAVRGTIQEQIKGSPALSVANGKAPVLLWGPYLWADGQKGRQADDLKYDRADFRDDGTHPSPSGQQKVAEQLVHFFTTDPTAKPWFTKK